MWISDCEKRNKAFFCALCLLCAPSAWAEWSGETEVEFRHDDNLNNAQSYGDIASDTAFSARILGTDIIYLDRDLSLSVGGESTAVLFDRYTGLNNLSLGANVALRKKWTLGPYAPWTSLSLSSERLNFSDQIRNGWNDQITVGGGQRISERWDVGAAYTVARRIADKAQPIQSGDSTDVFSQSSRTLTLDAEYACSERVFLTFGSFWRRGDVDASTRPGMRVYQAARAIVEDPVFGPGFYGYKLTATSYGLNAGISIAFDAVSSLRASIARQVTNAEGGNNYAKNVILLSWNTNF